VNIFTRDEDEDRALRARWEAIRQEMERHNVDEIYREPGSDRVLRIQERVIYGYRRTR